MLPDISEVFETVIFDQLTVYFTNNNLFISQQYGFRKNASTELAALKLIDRLFTQLKDFKIPVIFYMYLSKAFDSLSHDILLNKLTYYGVRNSANDLLRSYLSNHKQYVQIDDISSSIVSINTGVPQGSILGPLLFNICINDNFNFILFADDTRLNATVESFGGTASDMQLSISNELQKICKWLDLI